MIHALKAIALAWAIGGVLAGGAFALLLQLDGEAFDEASEEAGPPHLTREQAVLVVACCWPIIVPALLVGGF